MSPVTKVFFVVGGVLLLRFGVLRILRGWMRFFLFFALCGSLSAQDVVVSPMSHDQGDCIVFCLGALLGAFMWSHASKGWRL